jgi:hypothetical protein
VCFVIAIKVWSVVYAYTQKRNRFPGLLIGLEEVLLYCVNIQIVECNEKTDENGLEKVTHEDLTQTKSKTHEEISIRLPISLQAFTPITALGTIRIKEALPGTCS